MHSVHQVVCKVRIERRFSVLPEDRRDDTFAVS
jgi:hypothetical protein